MTTYHFRIISTSYKLLCCIVIKGLKCHQFVTCFLHHGWQQTEYFQNMQVDTLCCGYTCSPFQTPWLTVNDYLCDHNNCSVTSIIYGTAYSTRRFSEKTTFVHCFTGCENRKNAETIPSIALLNRATMDISFPSFYHNCVSAYI